MMMIQMNNERNNVIGLDRDLELIWRWLKWNQEKKKKGKKELKNYVFQFRINMRKIRIVVRNGPKSYFSCNSKEKLKIDFA